MGGSAPGPIGVGGNQVIVDTDTNAMTRHQVPQAIGLRALSGLPTRMQASAAPTIPVASLAGQTAPDNDTVKLTINGTIVAGGALSQTTIIAMNAAAVKTPAQWRRYIAYATEVKLGGSLAWRANNPGNLRDATSKIGSVSGAVGSFAVFANLDNGRAAQRALYLNKYGEMKVRDAIAKLTPPSENDTSRYLAELKSAGIDLDKDVKSQIDILMPAVAKNEGLISGTVVPRTP